MEIITHQSSSAKIAEIISDDLILNSVEETIDLIGDLYFQEFSGLVIHEKNVSPEFFDLKTGLAGEILQKFSNYRLRLAIVGDFSKYPGNNLNDFIFESNQGKHINFVASQIQALSALLEH